MRIWSEYAGYLHEGYSHTGYLHTRYLHTGYLQTGYLQTGYLHKLAILCAFLFVFFAAMSADAAAEDTSASVGTDIAKIIGLDYMAPDQWVEIANRGTGFVNFTDWTLMNEKNQTYSFPENFVLKPGGVIRVHSGYGNNTEADLFNSTLLWNMQGDSAALMDAGGKVISLYKYPVRASSAESGARGEPLFLDDTSSISGPLQPFLPDYRSSNIAKRSTGPTTPVNMTGHSFICHGGPLNWAWTSGAM